MAITAGALVQQGTRVRVRRSTLPIDPAVVGREGMVVRSNEYEPNHYDVVLDGETEHRVFAPSELEIIEQLKLAPEREAAKRRRALP